MPRLVILGRELITPEPYSAGHACTPAEAATLNAALTRGLAKACYREISERGEQADLQACVASYLKGFSQGHERLRAIEAEARRIGRARVEAALYRQGKKLASLAASEISALVAREAEREEVLLEATRRIDALRAVQREGLEELAGGGSVPA